MSYLFDIGSRRRKVARFISHVKEELARAFVEEKVSNDLTQTQLAEKLGVDKSVVSRQLNGEVNLTLRSIADLAWALDRDIEFRLYRKCDTIDNLTVVNARVNPTIFRKSTNVSQDEAVLRELV